MDHLTDIIQQTCQCYQITIILMLLNKILLYLTVAFIQQHFSYYTTALMLFKILYIIQQLYRSYFKNVLLPFNDCTDTIQRWYRYSSSMTLTIEQQHQYYSTFAPTLFNNNIYVIYQTCLLNSMSILILFNSSTDIIQQHHQCYLTAVSRLSNHNSIYVIW